MRTPAEVFRSVVEHGHYNDYSMGMCSSLNRAVRSGVISRDEYFKCREEIEEYLTTRFPSKESYLRSALGSVGLDHSYEARRAIFLDWDNRPRK